MRSDLKDVPGMSNETRERALNHAMLIEVAVKSTDSPELWVTATDLAQEAQGAALMTINSALVLTCREYRTEHELAGFMDIDEDEPGVTIHNHKCSQCEALQILARAITMTMGNIHRGTINAKIQEGRGISPKQLQELRNQHNTLLGQVHLAAGLTPEHAQSFRQTRGAVSRRAAAERGLKVIDLASRNGKHPER